MTVSIDRKTKLLAKKIDLEFSPMNAASSHYEINQ